MTGTGPPSPTPTPLPTPTPNPGEDGRLVLQFASGYSRYSRGNASAKADGMVPLGYESTYSFPDGAGLRYLVKPKLSPSQEP